MMPRILMDNELFSIDYTMDNKHKGGMYPCGGKYRHLWHASGTHEHHKKVIINYMNPRKTDFQTVRQYADRIMSQFEVETYMNPNAMRRKREQLNAAIITLANYVSGYQDSYLSSKRSSELYEFISEMYRMGLLNEEMVNDLYKNLRFAKYKQKIKSQKSSEEEEEFEMEEKQKIIEKLLESLKSRENVDVLTILTELLTLLNLHDLIDNESVPHDIFSENFIQK